MMKTKYPKSQAFPVKIFPKSYDIWFFFAGLLLLVSEIWKQWYLTIYINHGYYDWWYFPFQLCSLPMYLLLLLPFATFPALRLLILGFLRTYSLLGGIAVFVDTSGLHYDTIPLTIHSFTWHVLLILIGITSGIVYYIEETGTDSPLREMRSSHLLYLAFACIATILNLVLATCGDLNLFYISPYYWMQQVGFILLIPYLGNNVCILLYVLATMIGAQLLASLWNVCYQHLFHKKWSIR
jgi:hypothetical protein